MKSASRTEHHPYGSFIPKGAKALLLGTFPAWEFSAGNKSFVDPETMIDFNYGRIAGPRANLLWYVLGKIYGKKLDSVEAIHQFLNRNKIALSDVYAGVTRKEPRNSSDANLTNVIYNEELIKIIEANKTIRFVFCTSKGVKKIFERHFLERIKRKDFEVIALPSPSRSADRTFGREPDYKTGEGAIPYRIRKYKKHFPLK